MKQFLPQSTVHIVEKKNPKLHSQFILKNKHNAIVIS